jgi:hypothetical protein
LEPWGYVSNPNALGLRPSEPFSSSVIDHPFPDHLSTLALRTKPKRLGPGASAVCSHRESRNSLPQNISFGAGRVALLSFWTSQVPLSDWFEEKHLPFLRPLSSFCCAVISRWQPFCGPQGFSQPAWHFPVKGADLFGLSHPLSLADFLEGLRSRTIFSSQGP